MERARAKAAKLAEKAAAKRRERDEVAGETLGAAPSETEG
jgi:hypothetical protein